MKISRLTTLFKVWLENNSKRFKYKPIEISKDKYIFAGINPLISLKIINSLKMMVVNVKRSAKLGSIKIKKSYI